METKWSDTNQPRAKGQFDYKIHHVMSVKHMLFSRLFQHHYQQLFHEVGTKVIGYRCTVTNNLAHIQTTVEEEVHGTTNSTADK